MAKFLNTKLQSEWISRLIDETERELILLVPYIQLSDKLLKALRYANSRGVESLIIYRESKLSPKEREKLLSISNLNLMHHPNLHAKCYMNENYLIIGSMNLYEYSEKNNREMGVLFSRKTIEEKEIFLDNDNEDVFQDAIHEIKLIVNSAQMERPSDETKNDGFEFDIIKTPKERSLERCKTLNKYFSTKTFHSVIHDNDYAEMCENFYDKIDLIHVGNGFRFCFNYSEDRTKNILTQLSEKYEEDFISDFKFFVSLKYGNINLYQLYNSSFWNQDNAKKAILDKYNEGIEKTLKAIKAIK